MLFHAAFFIHSTSSSSLQSTFNLGGSGSWIVTNSNGSITANATVPGVVHTDLLSASIIPEPYAGFNELALHWVALENWTFSRTFTAPAAALTSSSSSNSVRLVFDGLDTVANITLNGRMLGRSINSFLKWQTMLPPGLLRAGTNTNELLVAFTCAQCYGQTQAAAFPVPLREFRANRYSYSGRPFIRKSQTHFGWNWGPGFTTQGIYRGVRLEIVAHSGASIDSVLVQQQPAAAAAAQWPSVWPPVPRPPPSAITVTLGVEVRCAPSSVTTTMHVAATVAGVPATSMDGSQISAFCTCPVSEVESIRSVIPLELHLAVGSSSSSSSAVDDNVSSLALWYPNGYGAQPLHNITVTLCSSSSSSSSGARGNNGECATPWTAAVGLRASTLEQEPLPYANPAVNDTLGPTRSFYFRINGMPIWGKGANDIPSDQFESRVTPARLRSYLTSARDAHMTMLRIWGGGLFERSEFYEMCDELGLLVYHDMMWSDQIYPWDKPFLATVAEETRYQVRRLSRHSSLVLWSLTNELLPGAVTNLGNTMRYPDYKCDEDGNDAACQWAPSGGGNEIAGSFIYIMGAQALFFDTVGKTIVATDSSRALRPTSPSNGWLSEEMLIPDMCIHQASTVDPTVDSEICDSSNPARGDAHFYTSDPSVCFNASAMLPPIKFCSENGAESWPSLTPIAAVTEVGDRWIGSEQMQFRERAGSWGGAQVAWVEYHFGHAPVAAANQSSSSGGESFETFLMLSQIACGLGLSAMAQQFRVQKKSVASGATMGHLIWQLQDNWPGQSFGLVNYGGEWKEQLHFVRRSFSPLLVTAAGNAANGAGGTAIHLISDLPTTLNGCMVHASLWSLDGAATAPLKSWKANVATVGAGGVVQALVLPEGAAETAAPGLSFLRLNATCNAPGGGATRSSGGAHFVMSTNFSLARPRMGNPAITASAWGNDGESGDCTLTLHAAAPALFVMPRSTKLNGRFSDSSFSMVPGEAKELSFKTISGGVAVACDINVLRNNFATLSLYDLLG